MMFRETIYALSSGALPSAVAVIRLSGPHVREALTRIVGFVPEPRQLVLATMRNSSGEQIDRGFVSYFAAPASFTGEDAAELDSHGGKAVVAALLKELSSIAGLRPADPGEFARRAYLNGKFDLTGAEALGDLIEAETEGQRRFAVANTGGRTAALYQGWRERIIHTRAMIEAELDFADEGDIPESIGSTVLSSVTELRQEILSHIEGYSTAEIIREGFQVALIGPPNAGKSSLLNALVKRDVAIVSDEPGTTRDLVVVNLDLGGMKIVLTDTAGIREGAGKVEQQGIERARHAAGSAHLVLRLQDITAPPSFGLKDEYTDEIVVLTKIDLDERVSVGDPPDPGHLAVSAKTGEGLDALLALLQERATKATGATGGFVPFRERHLVHLREAERLLGEFSAARNLGLELQAELLRGASLALGRIIGDVDVEDLLDVIFSRFCVGK